MATLTTLTKDAKNRIASSARSMFMEMRDQLARDTWAKVGLDDTVRRLISMNCRYHGFDEKALKAMPAIMQAQVKGVKVLTQKGGYTLQHVLRRSMTVPIPLILANAKALTTTYDNSISQSMLLNAEVNEMILPLFSPAGEMIGDAYQVMLDALRDMGTIASDGARFDRQLKLAMEGVKSLTMLCAVFPVVKHFITPEQEASLPMDLTKARGDAHRVIALVDMGEMIQLSMKVETYMERRVIQKED